MKFSALLCLALVTITSVVAKPPKYIKINGVSKINPEYTTWQQSQGQQGTTVPNPGTSLAVVSTMDDYFALNEAAAQAGEEKRPLAATTEQTMDHMQKPEVAAQVGVDSDEMVDGLQAILGKYEIPMGLMTKLMGLAQFDLLDFIIDDSGSMQSETDSFHRDRRPMTRWEEAIMRMKQMVEIISYVPIKRVRIKFLNRRDQVELERQRNIKPQQFAQQIYEQLDRVTEGLPSGTTPAVKAIEESFYYGHGKKVSRYFFGDGEPNRGEKPKLKKLVINRRNAAQNPITFLSCTGDDDQVEWMKELEEVAPFCAEYDDYNDERDEVLRDQGQALPFTRGFHLVGQLVAAFNPYDLDAMDESIPLTKYALDQLLGVDSSGADYNHYFNEFSNAQSRRAIKSEADKIKQSFPWGQYYELFLSEQYSHTIPVVMQFKNQLAQSVGHQQPGWGQQPSHQQPSWGQPSTQSSWGQQSTQQPSWGQPSTQSSWGQQSTQQPSWSQPSSAGNQWQTSMKPSSSGQSQWGQPSSSAGNQWQAPRPAKNLGFNPSSSSQPSSGQWGQQPTAPPPPPSFGQQFNPNGPPPPLWNSKF